MARRLLFLILILTAITGGAIWVKDLVLGRQVQFVFTQEGTLESPVEVDALVANTEQVVTTLTAGGLDKFLVQGDRVRRGVPVARIVAQNSGGKVDLISPQAGLVNYYIDGQEGLVTAKNFLEWDLDKFQSIKANPAAAESFQSGQAVFKITDNLTPTYLFFRLPEHGLNLSPGESVVLLVEGQKVNGRLVRISPKGPEGGMVVALNSFLPQSLGKRRLKLGWLDKKPVKGQIVPVATLVDKQGIKGVYIVKDGVVTWQRVNILSRSGDTLCIEGIKTSTPVITTPGYVKEGQILNS